MSKLKPPFRADHVGSLLRVDQLKVARKKFFDEESISREELTIIENACRPGPGFVRAI